MGIPPIFLDIQKRGRIAAEEMFRVFNMGIGMVLFVRRENLADVSRRLAATGARFATIGNVTEGERRVVYEFTREPAS